MESYLRLSIGGDTWLHVLNAEPYTDRYISEVRAYVSSMYLYVHFASYRTDT